MIQKLRNALHFIWMKFFHRSIRKGTLLDTVRLKLFGLEICVTRELAEGIPYELTVVVPRAELRKGGRLSSNPANAYDLETLLNSITIAHSPRLENNNQSFYKKIKEKR